MRSLHCPLIIAAVRVLIVASGSHGDVHPFLALGRELARRGHEVLVFASAHFDDDIRAAGLAPVLIGTSADYDAIVRHPDAFHPRRGFEVIAGATLAWTPAVYRQLDAHVIEGRTIVIGSTLALAARLIQETRGVPTAMVHLAPSIFRSAVRPPVMTERPLPAWLPAPVTRAAWWAADRWFVDPVICPALNRFRAELGLAPVRRVFHEWIQRGDACIGMFPAWFAEPQPDWPRHAQLTDFAFYDGGEKRPLTPEVEAFLDAGPPPVVFTSGTAVALEHRFFEASVEACRLSGRRGLLLTRYPEQVPAHLPHSVRHVSYAPFSRLFPRASAVVHHGGMGTLAQALRAGVPQLVRPLAFDQFDNAAHLSGIGVARVLTAARYTGHDAAAALDVLTTSSHVAGACRTAAARLVHADGAAMTADAILGALDRRTSG